MKNMMQPRIPTHRDFLAQCLGMVGGGITATSAVTRTAWAATTDIFGKINPPAGVDKYNAQAGSGGIGLVLFFSNMIRFATVIAGIWVFINFILAGWTYITSSGDTGAHKKVSEKLTMSVMGIMIIVGAYTIAALIGIIVFDDPTYIISPTLKGIQ